MKRSEWPKDEAGYFRCDHGKTYWADCPQCIFICKETWAEEEKERKIIEERNDKIFWTLVLLGLLAWVFLK